MNFNWNDRHSCIVLEICIIWPEKLRHVRLTIHYFFHDIRDDETAKCQEENDWFSCLKLWIIIIETVQCKQRQFYDLFIIVCSNIKNKWQPNCKVKIINKKKKTKITLNFFASVNQYSIKMGCTLFPFLSIPIPKCCKNILNQINLK